MNKLLFTLILLTAIVSEGASQDRFSIFGGANLAELELGNVLGNEYINTDKRVGGVFGFGFDKSLGGSEIAYLCINLMYVQKGASIIDNGIRGDWATDYTEVELFFKLGNKVFVEAGVGGSKLLNANVSIAGGKETDVSPFMKGYAGNVLLGAGFRLGPIVLSARYDIDFTPAFNDPKFEKSTQRGLLLLAGLSFQLN